MGAYANGLPGAKAAAVRARRGAGVRPLAAVLVAALLAASAWTAPAARAGDGAQRRREAHALWAHPPDIGPSDEAIRRFLDQCQRANIDAVVLLVKGIEGEIYWQSRRFPQAIAKGYESFDFLGHFTREAHARGIKTDAWLVDFAEGAQGAAFREHPEWAQLNPDGGTTLTEKLGQTRPYPYVWMCPSRRPGYVDQWLIPMFEEVAANYPVDSVHHDYVRYPGDVAPDSYCFCDYCIQHIPRYAQLSYQTRPGERYRVRPAQPRIEANWWSDPTMLPDDWDRRDRREKADFLLNGRTIPTGPPDMRYFFYDYRLHQIENFVREVAESVRRINPKIGVSVAVFKNPILSGRFLGQRWDEWTLWVDVFMPMTYRSHFAGDFDAYLDLLAETTAHQLEWLRREKPLYAGIASTYLYREELQPLDDLRERVNEFKSLPAVEASGRVEGALIIEADTERERAANLARRAEEARSISDGYAALRARLAQSDPERERKLAALVAAVTADGGRGATPAALGELSDQLLALRRDLPPGFLQPEKLKRAIEAARRANPDGIAIFSAGNLSREKLWPALEDAFKR